MLRSNQKGRIPVFVNLRQIYLLIFPPISSFCMSVFLAKEDLECETSVVLNIVFPYCCFIYTLRVLYIIPN